MSTIPKPKKSLIPYLIIGVLASFFVFIGQFVFKSMQSNTNLVTEHYYQDEVAYEERLSQKRNFLAIEDQTSIRFDQGRLRVLFPVTWKAVKGTCFFYNPKDNFQDVSVPFETTTHQLELITKELSAGWWTLKITFEYAGNTYYTEKKIKS